MTDAVTQATISPLAATATIAGLPTAATVALPAGNGATAIILPESSVAATISATSAPAQLAVTSPQPALATLSALGAVDVLYVGGPTGQAGEDLTEINFVGVAAGQQVNLPQLPGPYCALYINGAFQPNNGDYVVNNQTLIIPPGLVWDGAPCQFVF